MSPTEYYTAPHEGKTQKIPVTYFLENNKLSQVMETGKTTRVVTSFANDQKAKDPLQYVIIGVPLTGQDGKNGAVYIYQSVEVGEEMARETTKYILLAAGIAIILTTFFAFFLSTRINAPLRKMKQAAFEVARGKFDTKVRPLIKWEDS
jgi:two-component system sensor histidine kinase ResE